MIEINITVQHLAPELACLERTELDDPDDKAYLSQISEALVEYVKEEHFYYSSGFYV